MSPTHACIILIYVVIMLSDKKKLTALATGYVYHRSLAGITPICFIDGHIPRVFIYKILRIRGRPVVANIAPAMVRRAFEPDVKAFRRITFE